MRATPSWLIWKPFARIAERRWLLAAFPAPVIYDTIFRTAFLFGLIVGGGAFGKFFRTSTELFSLFGAITPAAL